MPQLLRLLLGLALLALLAACGSAPAAQPVAPTSAAEAGPVTGGTLIVVQASDPGSLNPAITTGGPVHSVTDQIFNGLVGLDDDLNPVPELAESWTISDDGMIYTFTLRSGVTWHDGTPFTAADVKFSFEAGLLKYHARTKAALEHVLEAIETPDDLTVVFQLRQPYGPLLQRLDVVEASIIPQHIYAGKDLQNDPANLAPIGTGPFKFVVYARGERIVLERNPGYFRTGRPYLERVIFQIIPDNATALLALEQGEVDYMGSVPGADLEHLQALPDLQLVAGFGGSGGSLCQLTLIPNLTQAPFDQLAVRQAFAHALDRQFILDRVYFGQGSLATGPISSQMTWAYTSDVPAYGHDPAHAEELLDQAGLLRGADGTRFSIVFTHPSTFTRLGEVLREQLKVVGINLELEALDTPAAVDKVFVQKDFDLSVASYCNGSDPEIGVRRAYISSNIGPIPFSNGAGYANPAVDRLLDAAAALSERTERAALYATFQQQVVADLPYFWLIDAAGYRAYRSNFAGFRVSAGPFVEEAYQVAGEP
ncbi:MAG: ABC transporter substrate-binding protein [Candidatus Viridilinea halotolerans]|uniref:ABC transporter substrate-binding protein n=1 Tax=Candidatus Viridilinea halotolerans TaxID=2491704 RepID=A0A426TQT6_9CHLR|nr:MAG: ABC transporter substrate-binding protein [Candidatus Viridilinea halotolerans]